MSLVLIRPRSWYANQQLPRLYFVSTNPQGTATADRMRFYTLQDFTSCYRHSISYCTLDAHITGTIYNTVYVKCNLASNI